MTHLQCTQDSVYAEIVGLHNDVSGTTRVYTTSLRLTAPIVGEITTKNWSRVSMEDIGEGLVVHTPR